jgi:hypothetical protein
MARESIHLNGSGPLSKKVGHAWAGGFVDEDISQFKVCATCWLSLNKQQVPALSRSNGFVCPPYPTDL